MYRNAFITWAGSRRTGTHFSRSWRTTRRSTRWRNGDRRNDALAKPEMLAGIDRASVLCIVEDRNSVVGCSARKGFACLQCAPGDF